MIRIALTLSLLLVTTATADAAGISMDEPTDHCAEFPDMIQAVAKARGEYDGLVAALREIPDRFEIQEFDFERLFVQKAILQIETLHGQLTPEQIANALAMHCAEMMP